MRMESPGTMSPTTADEVVCFSGFSCRSFPFCPSGPLQVDPFLLKYALVAALVAAGSLGRSFFFGHSFGASFSLLVSPCPALIIVFLLIPSSSDGW